jgi:hypothetical protein
MTKSTATGHFFTASKPIELGGMGTFAANISTMAAETIRSPDSSEAQQNATR